MTPKREGISSVRSEKCVTDDRYTWSCRAFWYRCRETANDADFDGVVGVGTISGRTNYEADLQLVQHPIPMRFR